MAFSPMLAATLKPSEIHRLRFPLLGAPKLDGIRGLTLNGKALTRRLQPIQNAIVRAFLQSRPEYDGLDGELMIHGETLHGITSVMNSRSAKPPAAWYFAPFDAIPVSASEPYAERLARATAAIARAPRSPHVALVPQVEISSATELLQFEAKALELGFEGVVLRRPDGSYKCGRCTDTTLIKLKRFSDAEAVIIGFEEERGGIGQQIGTLVVRDLKTRVVFRVGTGSERRAIEFWGQRDALVGQVVKYKFFEHGTVHKPRDPIFLALRDRSDL